MHKTLKGKSIAVTGCCGTIGKELVRQLITSFDVKDLVGIDNNESGLFFLEQQYLSSGKTNFFLGDVRDTSKLEKILNGVDILFHTAAYKHVALCEKSPFEAVQTNILGVQNIIAASTNAGVKKVLFTSSDKAVNPTNVMGTSKLMGERLMTAANCTRRGNGPILASTRFGNVLGSRGSVIPIFKEQIKRGGPVTLTSPEMTRFIMSIDEAVSLVVQSAGLACGGEVFITKMPVIRIKDLAEVMIEELASRYGHSPADIKIDVIGSKPGEKEYEELMTEEEVRRAWELGTYYVVHPAYTGFYRDIKYHYPDITSQEVSRAYNSKNETPLSPSELSDFLHQNNLLEDEDSYTPSERYWPGETKNS